MSGRDYMMTIHEAMPARRAEAPRALAANLVGGHLVVPTCLIAARQDVLGVVEMHQTFSLTGPSFSIHRRAASAQAGGLHCGWRLVCACAEPYRHVLDSVDEVGPEPGDLAVEDDAGHPPGDGLQQYPELEGGQVAAEAEVRTAAAETDMGVGVAADVELVRRGEDVLVPV